MWNNSNRGGGEGTATTVDGSNNSNNNNNNNNPAPATTTPKTRLLASPFFRPTSAFYDTNYKTARNTNKASQSKSQALATQHPQQLLVRTPRGKHTRIVSKGEGLIPTDAAATPAAVDVVPSLVEEKKSSLLGCTANMCTAIVGSGIVGIPYAIKETGFVAGIVLIVLVGGLTEKSLRLLINTAKHVQKQSYETTAEVAFGMVGFRFILVMEFVMAFGAMVTYLMITKDCACLLFGIPTTSTSTSASNNTDSDDDTTTSQHSGSIQVVQNMILVGVSFLTQFPLACLRDMAQLEKTSTIAVGIDCLIVAAVAYCSPWRQHQQQQMAFDQLGDKDNYNYIDNNIAETSLLLSSSSSSSSSSLLSWWEYLLQHDAIKFETIFVGLGVLSFAFECQESVFLVAGSLDNPTAKRWGTVTKCTLGACVTLALICGSTGYLGFGDVTQGNILNNLPSSKSSTIMVQTLLGLTMLATYPLASFVSRHVLIVLCFEGPRVHDGGHDSSILNRRDRRIGLTFVLYILALIPATVLTDMGTVLAFAGVVGGSSLAYIGPGLLFLAIHGGRFLELTETFFFIQTATTKIAVEDEESRNNNNHETTLSERTSLTNEINKTINGSATQSNSPTAASGTQIIQFNGIFRTGLWYIGGFAIWSRVAKIGKRRVLDHAKELAAKPHIDHLRIGDVDLRGMENLLSTPPTRDLYHAPNIEEKMGDDDDDDTLSPALGRSRLYMSLSERGSTKLIQPMNLRTDNTVVDLKIKKKNSKKKKCTPNTRPTAATSIPTLEPDPFEEPPNGIDFVIAIVYILFGCLAFVAGLTSLLVPDNE